MSQYQVFARLAKVDEAKRQVTGIIASETPDAAKEIFDYESSKPNFESWSGEVAKASGGQSVGNVRAMHGKVAAGRLTELEFNDVEKTITVVADIVDDNEWEKVQKGVYTGFSIGGRYARKWADPLQKGHKRYTAVPSEVSLVDLGCNPAATFTMLKADGMEEQVAFHVAGQEELLAKIANPDASEVEKRDAFAQLAKAYGVNIVAPEEVVDEEELAKSAYSIGTLARVAEDVCYLASGYGVSIDGTVSIFSDDLKKAAGTLYDALLKMVSSDAEEAKARLKALKKQLDEEEGEKLSKALGDLGTTSEQLSKVMSALDVEDGTLIDDIVNKINEGKQATADLQKSLTTEQEQHAATKAELEKLRGEPAPAKGATRAIAVSKEEDGLRKSADSGTSIEKDVPTDPLTAMKKAQQNGVRINNGAPFHVGG